MVLLLCITAKSKLIGISKFYCDFLINYNFLICTNPSGALSPPPLTHAAAPTTIAAATIVNNFNFQFFLYHPPSSPTNNNGEGAAVQRQKQNQKENFKLVDIAQTINLFPYTHTLLMIHMWNGIGQKGEKEQNGSSTEYPGNIIKM